MAFDEKGQAADKKSKIEICKRSYDILVSERVGYPSEASWGKAIFADDDAVFSLVRRGRLD